MWGPGRGAGVMNFKESDVSLFLWQRAAFHGSRSDDSGTRGDKTTVDSLRMRLGQLEHACWKEMKEGTESKASSELLKAYLTQYSSAMDSKGVDNYIPAVRTLSSNKKNDSRSWKTGLSREGVKEMPQVKALMLVTAGREVKMSERFTGTQSSMQQRRGHSHAQAKATREGNPLPESSVTSCRSSAVPGARKLVLPKPAESPPTSPQSIWRKRGDRLKGGGWRQRKTRWKRQREEDSDEEEGEGEGEKGEGGPGPGAAALQPNSCPFITAKDQYVLNQHKKARGNRAGEGSRGQGVLAPPHAGGSYGMSKKSLGGTRRTPSSRFVPPVKRGQEEESAGEGMLAGAVCRGIEGESGENRALLASLEGEQRLKNIDPRMVELIMNEIMDHDAPVDWDDIAGLEFAKNTIKEIVVWPMLRPDIFTGLRGPPKGILLFGPPGTGKTLIGKCVASQVKATFFSISASSLTSKWIGEGEKMVRALFAVARCFQPAVVFMDELDSLLCQRSNSEHESSRRIKTEFLVQLDGATTSADDRILVIGATNRPQEIDEAARRRLVKRLYIPLPNALARRKIVQNLMEGQSHQLSNEEVCAICEQSEGYSGADMASVCREAALGPVREAAENIQHISAEEMRAIHFKDFEAALQLVKPSVSGKDLELYVKWNKEFGCGRK